MSRRWISLILAFCLLLPTMNVNAGESSNEYFYSIDGEQIDTDGDNFFDKFHIYYDPDTSVEEYVTVDVEFDVYADGQHIGHAAEYHEIFNGDENVYHMNYTADYQSEYDFYVALYDGDNLEDEHWFYDIPLRAPGDGSEEEEEEEFVCDNGETIPMEWYDDGYDDCGDGSDEPNQGGDDDFVCDNGNTIPMDYYNDGWDDCGDGSDEPNGVGADQFICDNGEIVPVTWVNDYYDDCGDGSDEGESGGGDDEFVCDNGNTIPMDYYDDGYDDCGDGSDEPNEGGNDDFVCDNGNTIPIHWYDDGYDDCGDGSDEPNGIDSGDDGDEDSMSFGLPTG